MISNNELTNISGKAITIVTSIENEFLENNQIILANNTNVTVNQEIQFNCSAVEDGMNYEWNFGDSLINATIQNPTHKYSKSGFYLVKLTIISPTNEFSLYSILIEVKSVTNAPTGLSLKYTICQMQLTWVAPISNNGSAILGYKIYRGTSSGNEILLCAVGNITSYIDSNLIYGQTYYYRIATVNGIGEGDLSTEINAKAFGLPASPQNFTIKIENGYFNLSWISVENNSVSPITGYKIYRGISADSLSLLSQVGVVLSYLDTTVNTSQTYYYKVVAICDLGDGESSGIISARYEPANYSGIYITLGMFGGFGIIGAVVLQRNPILKEKFVKGLKTSAGKIKVGAKNASETAKDKMQNLSEKLKNKKQNR